jgi:hypothetical protein
MTTSVSRILTILCIEVRKSTKIPHSGTLRMTDDAVSKTKTTNKGNNNNIVNIRDTEVVIYITLVA